MTERRDRAIRWLAVTVVIIGPIVFGAYLVHVVRRGPTADPGYTVGMTVDIPESVIGTGNAVVVFARSTCPSCKASKPMLKQVTDLARQYGSRIVLVAVAGKNETELTFAGEVGIRPEEVLRYPLERLTKLEAVPTFLVLDANRTIRHIHVGASADVTEMIKIRKLLN
jgi:thioredoxin-related protein